MAPRPISGAFAAGVLLVTLWGCGGSAASSQLAAPPSAAAGSAAEPSTAQPSIATPSFVLPSAAKDVEALLPDQICGMKAVKSSISGEQVMTSADEDFKAILQALGKRASDVTVTSAVALNTGCSAGILRIMGADPGLLEQTYLAQQEKSGHTYTQKTVGGRNVYFADSTGGLTYVSFHGDAMIFTVTQDEASAAAIIQQLP
jgi:hypothetical protein